MSDEVGRRLVHVAGIGFPALYLLELLAWASLRALLITGTVVVVILEALRLGAGLRSRIYDHLTRDYEADTFAGYGYYMIGITLVALVFDPEIAIPAMLMLMLGDPLSGLSSGHDPGRIKRWQALGAMSILSLVVALPFTLSIQPSPTWGVLTALCGAVPATIADGVRVTVNDRIIDDNLTIPLAGAVGLWIGVSALPPMI